MGSKIIICPNKSCEKEIYILLNSCPIQFTSHSHCNNAGSQPDGSSIGYYKLDFRCIMHVLHYKTLSKEPFVLINKQQNLIFNS